MSPGLSVSGAAPGERPVVIPARIRRGVFTVI